jgi:hypothetical protein
MRGLLKEVKGTKAAPKVPKVVKRTKAAPKVPKVVKGTKAAPKVPKVVKGTKGTKAAPKVLANKQIKTKNGGGNNNTIFVVPYSPPTLRKATSVNPLIEYAPPRRVSPKYVNSGDNFRNNTHIVAIEELRKKAQEQYNKEKYIYEQGIGRYVTAVEEGNMLNHIERDKWYKGIGDAIRYALLQGKIEDEDISKLKMLINYKRKRSLVSLLKNNLLDLYEIFSIGFDELEFYLYVGYMYETETTHFNRNKNASFADKFGDFITNKDTMIDVDTKEPPSYPELYVLERLMILYEILKIIIKINNIEDRNLLSLLNQFNESIEQFKEDYINKYRFIADEVLGYKEISLFNKTGKRLFMPMINLVEIMDTFNKKMLLEIIDSEGKRSRYTFNTELPLPELRDVIEKAKKQ